MACLTWVALVSSACSWAGEAILDVTKSRLLECLVRAGLSGWLYRAFYLVIL